MKIKTVLSILLLLVNTLCILAAALMALLIGLVLSREVTDEQFKSIAEYTMAKVNERKLLTEYGDIENYSWLVSVNIQRYLDIPDSMEFVCPGVIIAPNKGNGCIKDDFGEEFRNVLIRSHSAYFFESRYTYTVKNIIIPDKTLPNPYTNIYILEVDPVFPDSTIVPTFITKPATEVALEICQKNGRLIVAGWGSSQQIFNKETLKHDPFFIEEWYPENMVSCNLCDNFNLDKNECCITAFLDQEINLLNEVNGRALIGIQKLGPPVLLAFELNHSVQNGVTVGPDVSFFLDLGQPEFVHWFRTTMPNVFSESNKSFKKETGYQGLLLYSKMNTEMYVSEMEMYMKFLKRRHSTESTNFDKITIAVEQTW